MYIEFQKKVVVTTVVKVYGKNEGVPALRMWQNSDSSSCRRHVP